MKVKRIQTPASTSSTNTSMKPITTGVLPPRSWHPSWTNLLSTHWGPRNSSATLYGPQCLKQSGSFTSASWCSQVARMRTISSIESITSWIRIARKRVAHSQKKLCRLINSESSTSWSRKTQASVKRPTKTGSRSGTTCLLSTELSKRSQLLRRWRPRKWMHCFWKYSSRTQSVSIWKLIRTHTEMT